jgi:hypothetical protein
MNTYIPACLYVDKYRKAKELVALGAGRVAQVVEHQPSKCEVLNSNSSGPERKKRKKSVALGRELSGCGTGRLYH